MRAVESVSITLADGVERKLVYTFGTLRRLRERLESASTSGYRHTSVIDVRDIPPEELIFEGLTDKAGMSPEKVADLMPLNEEFVAEMTRTLVRAVTGKDPGELQRNPPTAHPTVS